MNETIIKKARVIGDKGAKGNPPNSDTTVPMLSILFTDDEIPEGYELYNETPTPTQE